MQPLRDFFQKHLKILLTSNIWTVAYLSYFINDVLLCEGVRTRGLGGQVLLKFQSQHEQSQWKHSTDIQPHRKHKPPKETHKEDRESHCPLPLMQKKMFVVETEHPCQGMSAVSKHMPSYQKVTNWSMLQSLGMLLKLWQVILICSGWSYSLAASRNTISHGAHVRNLS